MVVVPSKGSFHCLGGHIFVIPLVCASIDKISDLVTKLALVILKSLQRWH